MTESTNTDSVETPESGNTPKTPKSADAKKASDKIVDKYIGRSIYSVVGLSLVGLTYLIFAGETPDTETQTSPIGLTSSTVSSEATAPEADPAEKDSANQIQNNDSKKEYNINLSDSSEDSSEEGIEPEMQPIPEFIVPAFKEVAVSAESGDGAITMLMKWGEAAANANIGTGTLPSEFQKLVEAAQSDNREDLYNLAQKISIESGLYRPNAVNESFNVFREATLTLQNTDGTVSLVLNNPGGDSHTFFSSSEKLNDAYTGKQMLDTDGAKKVTGNSSAESAHGTRTPQQYDTAKLNLSQIATPVESNPDRIKNTDIQTLLKSSAGKRFNLTEEQAYIAIRDGGFIKDGVRYALWQAKPGVMSGTFYVTEIPVEVKPDKVFQELKSVPAPIVEPTQEPPKNPGPTQRVV